MTDPKIPVTEDELHAYVDNELPGERRGDVEAWLAAHPDDAERVQSWRTMAEALHARYDAVANEPVPKRLEIERLVRPAQRSPLVVSTGTPCHSASTVVVPPLYGKASRAMSISP